MGGGPEDASAAAGDADLRGGGGATPGGSGLNLPPSRLMAGLAGLLLSAAAAAEVVEAVAVALRLGRSALELCGERAASDGAADEDGAAAAGVVVGVAAPPPAAFFFAWNFLSWRAAYPLSAWVPSERANRCACSTLADSPFLLLAQLWRPALPRQGRLHRPPWLLRTAMQDRWIQKGKRETCRHFGRVPGSTRDGAKWELRDRENWNTG